MKRTALFLSLCLSSPAFAQTGHEGHAHEALQKADELAPEERENATTAGALTAEKLSQLHAFQKASLDAPAEGPAPKSKLSASEMERLIALTADYYLARRTALGLERELAAVRARNAQARQAGKQPDPRDLSKEVLLDNQLKEHELFRGRFEKKYGAKARQLIDAREKDFVALLDEQEARKQKIESELKQKAAAQLDVARLEKFLGLMKELRTLAPNQTAGKALERSGLERQEALGLALLTGEYYRQKHATEADALKLADAKAQLAKKKAKGAPTNFEERVVKHWEDMARQFADFRAGMVKLYGEKAIAALDAKSADFKEIFAQGYDDPLGAGALK